VKPFYLSNRSTFQVHNFRYMTDDGINDGTLQMGLEITLVIMGRVVCSFERRPLVSPELVNQ
jgi:hypothetical protein